MTDHYIMVAAPAYLAARGRPVAPADLVAHECLMMGDMLAWPFKLGEEVETVRVAGRLRSSDGELLHSAALAGEGLLRAMSCSVAQDVADGRLVRVLGEFEVKANSAVWAVYPSSKYLLPKLRVLLEFLGEQCKSSQVVRTG
jgi:DNA-binding transcriptional LysR family regulator